jgi:cyclic lactone autoinducer peptide
MMKKLVSLLLVLAVTSVASASMVWIDQGDVPLEEKLWPSDTVVVPVYTDTALLGLDCTLTLTGPATIVDALSKSTAAAYGWDSGFTYDPVLPGAAVEIGAGNFSGAPGPLVGFFLVHCDGYGDVTATLTASTGYGGSMDITYGVPQIGGQIIIPQMPEPMTIALLGLGGLVLLRRRK